MATSVNLREVNRLFCECRRERLQHAHQRHLRPLLSVQDFLDDVRREQREPQYAGHVRGHDALPFG